MFIDDILLQTLPSNRLYEFNLNWFLRRFKELSQEWDETKAAWLALKEYVENFFDNLDVQDEINNKLDDLYESGELDRMFNDYGFLISVKTFGAKGDGETDDSNAFEQFVQFDGGLKYIPAGVYVINGVLKNYKNGAIGNGVVLRLPTWAQENGEQLLDFNSEHAIVIKGDNVTDNSNGYYPMIRISFIQDMDGNISWSEKGAGVRGIEVTGQITGEGNGMPIGIRSAMHSNLKGDGDQVAVWSRVFKDDPENGVNLSDSCAVHASAYLKGAGTGLAIAVEELMRNFRPQGARGTNYASFYESGGVVGTHSLGFSDDGMAQTHVLVGRIGDHLYGAWSYLSVDPSFCKVNGYNDYEHTQQTAVFKMPNFNFNHCPNYGLFMGAMPYHIKLNGAYTFNVGADYTRFYNSTNESNGTCLVGITSQPQIDVHNATSVSRAFTNLQFLFKEPNEDKYIRNMGNKEWLLGDIYAESNYDDFVFRSFTPYDEETGPYEGRFRNTNRKVRGMLFESYGSVLNPETVKYETYSFGGIRIKPPVNVDKNTEIDNYIYPIKNEKMNLGTGLYRWANIYSANPVIVTSDKRLKCDIEPVDSDLLNFAKNIKFKKFKYKSAINYKGSKARYHIGVIAQDLIDLANRFNVNLFEYGILCKDDIKKEDEPVDKVTVKTCEAEYDEKGNTIKEAEYEHIEPDNIDTNLYELDYVYSIRYEELHSLCLAALIDTIN